MYWNEAAIIHQCRFKTREISQYQFKRKPNSVTISYSAMDTTFTVNNVCLSQYKSVILLMLLFCWEIVYTNKYLCTRVSQEVLTVPWPCYVLENQNILRFFTPLLIKASLLFYWRTFYLHIDSKFVLQSCSQTLSRFCGF